MHHFWIPSFWYPEYVRYAWKQTLLCTSPTMVFNSAHELVWRTLPLRQDRGDAFGGASESNSCKLCVKSVMYYSLKLNSYIYSDISTGTVQPHYIHSHGKHKRYAVILLLLLWGRESWNYSLRFTASYYYSWSPFISVHCARFRVPRELRASAQVDWRVCANNDLSVRYMFLLSQFVWIYTSGIYLESYLE